MSSMVRSGVRLSARALVSSRSRHFSLLVAALGASSVIGCSSTAGDATDASYDADEPPPPVGNTPRFQSTDPAIAAPIAEKSESAAGSEEVGQASSALTSNGCSNPAVTQFLQTILHPFTLNVGAFFRGACDRHDYCYSSGKAFYGDSRSACDSRFLSDMESKCRSDYNPANPLLLPCLTTAAECYGAVRTFGESHFENTPCLAGQTDTADCSTHEPFENRAPISKDYILFSATDNNTYFRAGAVSAATKTFGGPTSALGAYAFRAGALAGNNLYFREGEPENATQWVMTGLSKFQISGNRIGGLFQNGNFFLLNGALSSPWGSGLGSAYDFAIDQNRVLVGTTLQSGATKYYDLYFKKGSASSAYTRILRGLEKLDVIAVAGSRIATQMATTRGEAVAISEDDGATWSALSTSGSLDPALQSFGMDRLKLAGKRITTLIYDQAAGAWNLWATDAAVAKGAVYTRLANKVTNYDMTSTRLAAVTGGRLFLKDGALTNAWIDVGPATSVQLSGNRVAFLDGSTLYALDGTPSATWSTRANWTKVATNVKSFSIWQKGSYEYADYVDVIHP